MTAVNTPAHLCRVLSLVILMMSVLVQVSRATAVPAQILKSANSLPMLPSHHLSLYITS